ncbi:MAG: hypothetical protein ACXW3D_05220 [Caulobacteraceae bacterium]
MIFLHIGTHKTGTTAIQRVFAESRGPLRAQGLNFVQLSGCQHDAHHDLAWALGKTPSGLGMPAWDEARSQFADPRFDRHVISSEAFWFTDPTDVLRELKGFDHALRIVIYLRRQDHYLEALYKQVVKIDGYAQGIDTWLEKKKFRGDYKSTLDRWGAVFGRNRLDVRLYDAETGPIDAVQDFLDLTGVADRTTLKALDHPGNPSPRKEIIQLLLALNQLPVRIDRGKMFKVMMRRNGDYARSSDLLSSDRRRALVDEFAEVNEAIRHEFFPEQERLFPLVTDERPVLWALGDPSYQRMLADFLQILIKENGPSSPENDAGLAAALQS